MTLWFRWRDLFRGSRPEGPGTPWLPPSLGEPPEEAADIVAPGESFRFLGQTLVAGSGSVVPVPAPEGR
jgi:hypothetical protein